MKKFLTTVIIAGALLIASPVGAANLEFSNVQNKEVTKSTVSYANPSVDQVASSRAYTVSGTYKTNYNTNVRADAGTNYKKVTLAKKGTIVTATHKKTIGGKVWYKVNVNGKSGWILSSLLAIVKPTKKATTTKSSKSSTLAASGSFTVKAKSNVRSGAGTNNKIVTSAKKGTKVTVSSKIKVGSIYWYKINVNGKTGWISGSLLTQTTTAKITKKAVTKTSTNISTTNSSNMINIAKSLLGTPYRFGGTTTAGFDCSGYVQYVYKKSGKNISRNTATQFAQTDTVTNPQPGDLVFFANTYKPGISHVGIYIGNNSFIHSGGKKAEIISLNNSYWGKKFHSFKRL